MHVGVGGCARIDERALRGGAEDCFALRTTLSYEVKCLEETA